MATRVGLDIVADRRIAARVKALEAILADREAELLALQGPCSNRSCRLHSAHRGPCDVREI